MNSMKEMNGHFSKFQEDLLRSLSKVSWKCCNKLLGFSSSVWAFVVSCKEILSRVCYHSSKIVWPTSTLSQWMDSIFFFTLALTLESLLSLFLGYSHKTPRLLLPYTFKCHTIVARAHLRVSPRLIRSVLSFNSYSFFSIFFSTNDTRES